MISRTKGIAALALALTLPLAACDDGTDAEFGEVSLMLTDANDSEITEAWVTFTDIYLQGGNDDGEGDPEASREYLLQDGLEEYELTSLAGEVANLVVGQVVPTGSYGQLRVVLGDACIVTPDGVFSSSESYTKCGTPTGEINLTSTDESGWKVLLNGLVVDGDQEIILLDFLVDESFLMQTGNANKYNLYPVIKGADVSMSGGFDVTLADPDGLLPEGRTLDEFSVTMEPAEGDVETVAFVLADEVFGADFEYEMPGQSYTFTLVAPDDLTVTVAPASPQVVELGSGQTVVIDWVITEVVEASS
jgi:hypothetical protein